MHKIFFSFKNKLKGYIRRTKHQLHRRTRKPTIIFPGTELDMCDKFAKIPAVVEKK